MKDFKYEKFKMSKGLGLTRLTAASNGCPVTFSIGGDDLSVMRNSKNFKDFDALSDKILANLEVVDEIEAVTFWWHQGPGFVRM